MSYDKLKSLIANVNAIETAMAVRLEKRKATPTEKETLSLYSGFGAIKEILEIGSNLSGPIHRTFERMSAEPVRDAEHKCEINRPNVSGDMGEQIKRLENLISSYPNFTDQQRKDVIEGIKSSVLTAFYTPQYVIDTIANEIQSLFKRNGIFMRSFLEPSAGTGGFLPVAMPETQCYAFEKDPLTGIILSLLNDDTETVIGGFETISSQDMTHKTFDVIASNIPFGNFRVFDSEMWKKGGIYEQSTKTIHNYFFIKSMELLNEGGLLSFITTRGIADTTGNKFVREYLINNANLITALRLPDNLFLHTGGIEVGSDLLIFQKNTHKATPTSREKMFLQTSKEMVDMSGIMTEYANKLFTQPRTALSTSSSIVKNQFGKYVRKYKWENGENALIDYLSKYLRNDFDRYFSKRLFTEPTQAPQVQMSLFDLFGEDFDTPTAPQNKGKRAFTDKMEFWYKDGAMILFEGQLGFLKFRKSSHYNETAVDFVPMADDFKNNLETNTERANDYLPIRKTYFELSINERERKIEYADLRELLNKQYDRFISKWGTFHSNDNKEFIMLDTLGIEVFTIENENGTETSKADIMREPVAFKKIDTAEILTPQEALASSLNFFGKVDLSYISARADKREEEIINDLKGEIFYNPVNKSWDYKGLFLSGNVVAKYKEITTILSDLNSDDSNSGDKDNEIKGYIENSLKALEDITPEPIPYEELDINMGERWIDTQLYADFATHLFGTETQVMYFDVNDTYVVSCRGYSPVVYNTYSVRNIHGEDMFVHALQDTVPEITKEIYRDGEKVRVPDEEAIQEASTKIQDIRNRFNEWLDRQPLAVRDELVRIYNERFNCYVRPKYDGSAQTFPNLTFEQFPYNELYPSQKDAIWMIKQNGGGICWHEVGTGKTMIMCISAYEMKRLGLVEKPMIIGLKANVHEIADTFMKAYPSAKVLYPGKDDFTPAKRKEVFSKIANNNWDCIIMTHEQFAKIPQSNETMIEIFYEELADVERSLEALENSTMRYRSRAMEKGLQNRQENLKAKLAELKQSIEERKDDTLDFRSMGIDHIFIDECHMFKNLMFQTRHTRVAGIGNNKGSQRAMNLLFAIRDIQRRTGRDLGATFLSGTVVVNALTELYVMFKYLRPIELKRQRISCFDAWAAIFTKKTADYELNVTGSIKRKERFRTYIKVPELAAFLREITDYRTADMINLDVPEKNVRFLSHAPTAEQEDMIKRLVNFANSGEWSDLGLSSMPPENLDKAKMLIATNVARKMALDMRLLGDKFSDDSQNKASICADTIFDYYQKSDANKGTQFVFSDLSTYRPDSWNIYVDIKEKLISRGIPADEIQFIQCAKTERARKRLFEDMNNGKVRVLFGSTSMLGTGVNAQKRAVAVHHLEIPWRPADLEQRNGRAVRKGNTVKLWGGNVVDVVIYGTEKTLDAYKFNLLRNKQMFINQINNGTIAVRRIDEDSMDEDNGMNFAEFVAILSGNSDLLNKAKLDNKIMQLEKEYAIFKKERSRAERKIATNNQDIEKANAFIFKMETDYNYFKDYKGERFVSLNTIGESAGEDLGRELHRISRTNRSKDRNIIGSYIGLNLSVRSEYSIAGTFDRNLFFVQGVSGINYRCGQYGSLPQGFVESSYYPERTLENIPNLIDRQREQIARLEKELPTLQEIVSRQWSKTAELETLKKECADLQRRIAASLKAVENGNYPEETKPKETAEIAA